MRLGLVSAIIAGALVAGCANNPDEASASKPVPQRELSVVSYSYSAMDRLVEGSLAMIDPARPVLVTTVVNAEDLNDSSPFGRMVADQMGSRLANGGYTVHELKMGKSLNVKEGTGEMILTRDIRAITDRTGAQAIVVGTYTTAKTKVFVNVKLVRAVDGRVLSAVDYDVPLTPDVKRLMGATQSAVYHPQ